MTCSWLDDHPKAVVDGLWGNNREAELWDHLNQCPECTEIFYEMNGVVTLLKDVPWSTPPRLVYLQPREKPMLTSWARTSLSVAAGIFMLISLGFLGGKLYLRNSNLPAGASSASLLNLLTSRQEDVCSSAVQAHLKTFEDRFWNEHQRLFRDLITRVDNQEAGILQMRNDFLKLQQRNQALAHARSRTSRDNLVQPAGTSSSRP